MLKLLSRAAARILRRLDEWAEPELSPYQVDQSLPAGMTDELEHISLTPAHQKATSAPAG